MQINSDPAYLASQGLSRTFADRFLRKILFTNTHWLWIGFTDQGYGMIHSAGKVKIIRAHRASWILFRGPIPTGKLVLHKCPSGPNRRCVNPFHLGLGGQVENMADAIRQGTHGGLRRGEDANSSKLTWDAVREIRSSYATGEYTYGELSDRFQISRAQLTNIIRNRHWLEV